ncbi:HK97 family phage prohead protease [Lysinibacillus sp. NPDC048646]|uniref:HK97 family phage prohead protease n=1 Tax=Lysinibacillus sp. NPDC048646 TaxID=3390574 RepID=UPI003D0921B9
MTKPLVISGYALCWNERACIHDNQGRFYEQFLPGAFVDSIKKRNQTARYFHMSSLDFASAEAGQLTLFEDERGLSFRIELKNNHENRMFYNLVKDKEVCHVSVGFHSVEYDEVKRGRQIIRYIKRAELIEISLVENPAYKTSSVQVGCNNRRLELISKIDKALSR